MLKDLAITCTVTFKDGTTQKQTIKFEEIYMSNEELGVQRDADYKYNPDWLGDGSSILTIKVE